MQIPKADPNELSKILEIGSNVRTCLCLGDMHSFTACSFLSKFTYGRNMMAAAREALLCLNRLMLSWP